MKQVFLIRANQEPPQSYLSFVSVVRERGIGTTQGQVVTQSLDALRYIKDVRPHWNQDCQDAFDALKHILFNLPVLSLYDSSLPLLVGTNAGQFGVGAILYQIRHNNKHQYIVFVSKALNPAQHNYPATKHEMLAILMGNNPVDQERDGM